jgi:hypothetical protein
LPDDADFTLEAARTRLLICSSDLPRTAREVAELLAETGQYFERGKPVSIVADPVGGGVVARPLTRESVVHAVHAVAQPYAPRKTKRGVEDVEVTLPDRVALLYLDLDGKRGLPPLHGITYAPILSAGGRIRSHDGYDAETGQYCANVPDLSHLVPVKPTRPQAAAALMKLRKVFATFPFADAPRRRMPGGLELVDVTKPPGMDESALLAALLTAICRPSLDLAPGLVVRAPNINGSGTGKGLLVRALGAIAFGNTPSAITVGPNVKELELRLGAALMDAAPVIFLDNLNGIALQSNLLASVMAERPAAVRVLGLSKIVVLNSSSYMVITGNGLDLSEDLVRRFLVVELDARVEDAEARAFPGDLLADVKARRAELLAAALTIWRWAQMNPRKLTRGATLGSYTKWAAWVRDPLLTLGTTDPVTRIADIKAADFRRQDAARLFETWHERHSDRPMRGAELHQEVRALIDPQGRGRQFIAAELSRLVGTQIAGLTLTRCKSPGKWSADTYTVRQPPSLI